MRFGGHRTLIFCVLIIAVTTALHVYWLIPNHDNEWYLIAATRMLGGGRYMADFMDPNPPLIMLLNMPPIMAARLTHVNTYTCFIVYVELLVLLSLGLARRWIWACLRGQSGSASLALVALALVLTWLPGYDFGQREHLFAILFLPFVFWSAARAIDGPARLGALDLIIITLAALGVLIKPFYVLVPASFLIIRMVGKEKWRALLDPAVFVFAAVALSYAAFVFFAYPELIQAAIIQKMGYAAWHSPWQRLLYIGLIASVPISVLLATTLWAPLSRLARMTLWHGLVASVVCLLLAAMQETDWSYHWLPELELAFAGLSVASAALLPRLRPGGALASAAAGWLAIIAVTAMPYLVRPISALSSMSRARYAQDPLLVRLRQVALDRPVLLLTSGFVAGYPSIAQVRLGASAPSQVLLPGAVMLGARGGAADRARGAELRDRAVEELVNDLERFRPLIVAVDRRRSKQALPDDFDVLAFYMGDPRFRRLWSGYRAAPSVTGWDLYRRTGDGAP